MKKGLAIALLMLLIGLVSLWGIRHARTGPETAPTVTVQQGPLEVWSLFDGALESRQVREIMSSLDGSAAIIDLAADGDAVRTGDVLVRFDRSFWEREHVRLSRDWTVAREEFSSLRNAKLPLEEEDLRTQVATAWQQYSNEVAAVEDLQELLAEGLVATQEVVRQTVRQEAARGEAQQAERRWSLTRTYLHPAARERAQAVLESAEQEVGIAERQLSNCVVRAPCDGLVAHKAVSLGAEFRTVRIGDSVFRNQPFLTVSDMSNLVVRCAVPESDLLKVPADAAVEVRPLAYPDLRLRGAVESVGGMAQAMAGKPAGQRYFGVVVRLDEHDARLRAGMSVQVRVLSYTNPSALLVPRAAVDWRGEQAYCIVVAGEEERAVPVRLGRAGETEIEVLDGLSVGEQVRLP